MHYRIEGLFGRQPIDFELAENGPTLLTGANGTGKSTVLRTIEAVSAGAWQQLAGIPFSELTLTFSSKNKITVTQNTDGLRIGRTGYQSLPWNRPQLWTVQPQSNYPLTTFTGSVIPSLYTSNNFTLQPSGVLTTTVTPATPSLWTNEIFKDFPVLYVSDDRLVTDYQITESSQAQLGSMPIRASGVVDQAAQDIGQIIESSLAEYAQRVQTIDREFPARVIGALERAETPSDTEIDKLLTGLNRRREELQRVGLLPENEAPLKNLNLDAPNAKTVIRVFVEDILRKLDTLEPTRSRLELFTDFLNRHYRGKAVALHRQHGAVILDTEAKEPKIILPSSLSSGEQHILVLAHRVLFRAGPGTLVLIDEPELSLHILWQDTFVDDMDRMGAASNLSFLFATHSPTLVAGRDDLRRALEAS